MADFAELNELLYQACLQDAQRRTRGQSQLVAELWESEKVLLLSLSPQDYQTCTTKIVKPNRYLQVDYEINRYSVPYDYRDKQLVLQALTYRIGFLCLDQVIASHPRCFGKEQDIYDPLHYLPGFVQRPGAIENAKPLNGWDGTKQDVETCGPAIKGDTVPGTDLASADGVVAKVLVSHVAVFLTDQAVVGEDGLMRI